MCWINLSQDLTCPWLLFYVKTEQCWTLQEPVLRGHIVWSGCESLSKTTKLILLDSLLQEVCISSGFDWSLALSSLGLSVCLSQSQTTFFRAKESSLFNRLYKYNWTMVSFIWHLLSWVIWATEGIHSSRDTVSNFTTWHCSSTRSIVN